jgi:NAD(P)H-hydrate epimerase
MTKFVTVSEMLDIERTANKEGLTYDQMMENAGRGLAEVVSDGYPQVRERGVLGLVGKGNNGGDALVAVDLLFKEGWKTSAYIVGPREDDDPLMERLITADIEIINSHEDKGYKKLKKLLRDRAVVLDGLLGTGIKLPLREPLPHLLKTIGSHIASLENPPIIIAVDCPSGVDCETGDAAPECIKADLTVCMAAVKTGMLKFPTFDLLGELRVIDIGLPDDLKPWKGIKRRIVDRELVREILPRRPTDAHKGTFGTLLVVAGSINYTGAALLAGKAAYRIGAGLVTLAVPTPLHSALAGQFPEATWLLLPHESGVIASGAAKLISENLDRVTTMLVGPGLGLDDSTEEFIKRLFNLNRFKSRTGMGFIQLAKSDEETGPSLPPVVVDADGLKLLAKVDEWYTHLPYPAVLTPHPGEMAILTGLTKDEIQSNRLGVAERFAQKWGHVLVLKGAITIVASPDGETDIIPVASPALARAGTGDVLAGIIAGLRAQGVDAFNASAAGAWIHAQTGLEAAKNYGSSASVLAGDLLDWIPHIISN